MYFNFVVNVIQILFFVQYVSSDISVKLSGNHTFHTYPICRTVDCKAVAEHILSYLNKTADPCEDFYKFSCGKWITDDLDEVSNIYDEIDEAVYLDVKKILLADDNENKDDEDLGNMAATQLARLYYKTCLDETLINDAKDAELKTAIKELGGWPILNKGWNRTESDITTLLGQLLSRFNTNPFFQISSTPDPKNRTINRLTIEQSKPILEGRDYYLNKTRFKSKWTSYKNLINGVINILRGSNNSTNVDDSIKEILDFETNLAKITEPLEDRINQTLQYNLWTIQQLSNEISFLNWPLYFDFILSNTTLRSADFKVVVKDVNYMKQLQNLLKKTDVKIIRNFIFWYFVYDMKDALDSRYQSFFQIFTETQNTSREYFCYKLIRDSMPTIIGALYVRAKFAHTNKPQGARQLMTAIKHAAEEIIEKSDWMDNATKTEAMRKLRNMKTYIGYVPFLLNDTSVDEEYDGLNLTEDDSFFTMTQKIAQDNCNYDDLETPVNVEKFNMLSPAVVNTFNIEETNAAIIHASMIQFPYYLPSYPKYINYGAMGFLMAHEMMHAFDNEGAQYDQNGNLNNWWTKSSLQTYEKKKQCIVDQFNQYTLPGSNLHVNGRKTLGENIPDVAGLEIALKAYEKHRRTLRKEESRLTNLDNFTDQQMFFINFARIFCEKVSPSSAIDQFVTDVHSPSYFRANGLLTNFDAFTSAFNCPKGSKMNPVVKDRAKCSFWN